MTETHSLLATAKHYLDVHFLITTFGYPGIMLIVFAETGLMLGFFLPGDSLLITAGIFASKGFLHLGILLPFLFLSAVLGNIVGYFFGQKVGKRLFTREESLLFHPKHVKTAQAFYNKYGGKAIFLARFMPIIRTFAPIVAGITDMHFPTFLLYNILGGFLWTMGLTLGGFFLGKVIPDKYFELIILTVIVVSLLPAAVELLKAPEHRKHLISKIQKVLKGK